MKPRNFPCSQRVLARAARLALLTPCLAPGLAWAQDSGAAPSANIQAAIAAVDGDIKELICPSSYIDLGALGVSKSAPKFGEYNGLEKSGLHALAGFGIAGGGCQNADTLRWEAYGHDLGTTSRNLGLEAGRQGQWSIGIGLDQMRHYTTAGYQTPYQGAQGGNLFVLPPDFGVINTTGTGGANVMTPAQMAMMRTINVYNERRNTTFNAGYAFNRDWSAKFDYKRIDMSGAKLIGGGSDKLTGANGLTYTGQAISLKLNPNKFSTDIFSLSANWTGQKAYASFEYYASLFHDHYKGFSWSDPFVIGGTAAAPLPATGTAANGPLQLDTMGTPPSNQFHQLNISGGYFLAAKTRLTGGLSFGINTQNVGFDGSYTPAMVTSLGAPSLNGRVLTRHADAKLTHQFSDALNFSAGLKFNERDNTTPANVYQFLHLGAGATTTTSAPMSNRRTELDANLDYRIDKNQRLHLGYNHDHIQRWCNSALANNAQGILPATVTGYYVVAACAQVPKSTDNSLNLSYKRVVLDDLDISAGYTYADRGAKINPSFYNPMQTASNGQGFENYGWLAWFQAPRHEHKLKAGLNWQATRKLNLGLSGYYVQDRYRDSALGVQDGSASNVNLDVGYNLNDNLAFGAYASWQNRMRYLLSSNVRSPVVAPASLWSNSMYDRDIVLGLTGKQKYHGGKLELAEDLSYSHGRSGYQTNLIANIAPAVGNSGQTPDIKSTIITFRLTGSYALNKHARLTAGWVYQRLLANDYLYNAYQYGFTPTAVMPNGLQAPSYTVNAVYAVYRYTF